MKRDMINESLRYMMKEEVSDELYNKAIDDFKNEKFTTKSGTEWETDFDNRGGYISYLSDLTQDKFDVVGTPYWEGEPILPFVVTHMETGDIIYEEKIVLPGDGDYNKEDLKVQIVKQLEIIEGLVGSNSSESTRKIDGQKYSANNQSKFVWEADEDNRSGTVQYSILPQDPDGNQLVGSPFLRGGD